MENKRRKGKKHLLQAATVCLCLHILCLQVTVCAGALQIEGENAVIIADEEITEDETIIVPAETEVPDAGLQPNPPQRATEETKEDADPSGEKSQKKNDGGEERPQNIEKLSEKKPEQISANTIVAKRKTFVVPREKSGQAQKSPKVKNSETKTEKPKTQVQSAEPKTEEKVAGWLIIIGILCLTVGGGRILRRLLVAYGKL